MINNEIRSWNVCKDGKWCWKYSYYK
jgi:hypothetical protein